MNFSIGDVFLVENDEIFPVKRKLSVCVCINKNWFFLINSENRKNYDCVPIAKEDNSFLKHDSFVSCSRYFYYEQNKIKKSKHLGKLNNSDLEKVSCQVKESEILEQMAIEIISKNLDEYLGL